MKNNKAYKKDREYKLLLISDVEILDKYPVSKVKEMFKGIDIVLSCGDLKSRYLEYVGNTLNKPIVYVNGNHYDVNSNNFPFGYNLDGGGIIKLKGLLIAGFDGSRLYSYEAHQYSDNQVKQQVRKVIGKLFFKKPDIIISHAPISGFHEGNHEVHMGFKAYKKALDSLTPKLWIHGHVHLKNHHETQESTYKGTRIINAYGYKIITFKR